jgi:hypothetical protein
MHLRNIHILLLIVSIGCSCKNQTIEELTTKIEIEFDGFANEFYNKHDLIYPIEKRENIDAVLKIIENTNSITNCKNFRLPNWKIKLYTYNTSNEKNRILILSSNESEIENLMINSKCYEAAELSKFFKFLINFDGIQKHNGALSQSQYEQLVMANK